MQDLFEFPNTILYNSLKKSTIPQCSLKRNFTEYAKRYQKIANYIWRNPPYSLWWNIFNSPLLPKTQTQMDFSTLLKILSTEQVVYIVQSRMNERILNEF